jgi:hypothetical protein
MLLCLYAPCTPLFPFPWYIIIYLRFSYPPLTCSFMSMNGARVVPMIMIYDFYVLSCSHALIVQCFFDNIFILHEYL